MREYDWVPGWKTDWVLSNSGVAEADCIFQTPARPDTGGAASIWVITRHDEPAHEVEMIKVTPGVTVGKLQISLSGQGESMTRMTISYEFTSLGPLGDAFLEGFTGEWYKAFMQTWQDELNHYLETGETLPEGAIEDLHAIIKKQARFCRQDR